MCKILATPSPNTCSEAVDWFHLLVVNNGFEGSLNDNENGEHDNTTENDDKNKSNKETNIKVVPF